MILKKDGVEVFGCDLHLVHISVLPKQNLMAW